jgi:hypothetical protein
LRSDGATEGGTVEQGGSSGAGLGPDLTAELDPRSPSLRADLHDPTQRAAVERALSTVPGVLSARVVPGFERPIDELHVLTDLDKVPKQAVRDIQTVLMARFGVPTDHRVISVVQLDEQRFGGPSATRLTIEHVSVTHTHLEVRAEVSLRDGDEQLVGHGVGPATAVGRQRAVARATIDAVGPLFGDGRVVELEGTEVTELLGQRIAISVVQFRTARGEHTVAGSAIVRDATAEAVTRSVLDALNRSISEAAAAR